ncbi:interleukin-1 receptor accessory protein-like 1-A [Pimephales promelas]|nr:interleukin-1 receptor accessory protein-like 1-A [Pimephales promelas]
MPEVVAAGSTVVLNGCVNIVGPVSETWVTVEPSASSSLPGGLLVASCLHSLPPKRNIQVPVVLKNETQVDLTIPPRAVLAEVHTVQSVIEGRNPVNSPVCEVVRPAQAKIFPDFGDSPLSSEWRERITDLVSSMSDVFALHDLDYGRTDKTIKDAYALPNLEEAFSALTGSKWFSVLDLKSGFYQIEMEEADKHKTAFVCPLGFYEFNRMPQGVTNAPSSFQRLMERCMGDLNRREVLVFVDDLIIQYRAGKQNLDADGLSRRPHGRPVDDLTSQKERERIKQFTLHHLAESEQPTILPAAVKALCERHQVYQNCDDPDLSCFQPTVFESLCINTNAVPLEFQQEDTHGLPILSQMSEEELRERQRADPELKEVIKYLECGQKSEGKLVPVKIALWLREWNRLEFRNGVLFRRRQDRGDVLYQLALPVDLRETVLTSLHNDMGHLGIERTLDLARSRFYWPRMAMTVEEKIKACERCVRRKTLPERAAPLVNIATSRPLELVCIDYLSLEPDCSNIKDILVITDHFTKYSVAMPTRNQKAQTVAKCLWDNFFIHYGFPEKILSDQGPDFESKLIKELCGIAGIRKRAKMGRFAHCTEICYYPVDTCEKTHLRNQ